MLKLLVSNELQPVRYSLHLSDLFKVLPIQYTHRHQYDALLFLIQASHELHEQLVPECVWLQDLHRQLRSLIQHIIVPISLLHDPICP